MNLNGVIRGLIRRVGFPALAYCVIFFGTATRAEEFQVEHVQTPLHRSMVARSESGKIIANVDFLQVVQHDQVQMRLTYHFLDGSIDDETTAYTQQGTFRLVRDQHVEKGPYFSKPFDFTVETANGIATTRKAGDDKQPLQVESKHVNLPNDLANGIVGTLLLNVPQHAPPYQVQLLVPLQSGRLVQLAISPEGERSFRLSGRDSRAKVFRIHPDLGGIVGLIARLIGVQPKDVLVWVMEGEDPAVVRIVGQLGGYGPVVDSVLEGASFDN